MEIDFCIKVLNQFVAEEGSGEERACWAEVKRTTSDNKDYAKCREEFFLMPGCLKLSGMEIVEVLDRHFA